MSFDLLPKDHSGKVQALLEGVFSSSPRIVRRLKISVSCMISLHYLTSINPKLTLWRLQRML